MKTLIDLRILVKDEEMQVILPDEHPTPYDHSSIGLAEAAVEQVTGLLLTLKLCLENKLRWQITSESPLVG